MEPSLYSLFRRGHYGRQEAPPSDDENSTEVIKFHQERERFASAAIAFCLVHDPAFQRHFLKSVCGWAPTRGERPSVEIEPRNWADLRLQITRRGKRHLFVVECKLGAPLEAHQDPSKPAFTGPKGYGSLMRDFGTNPGTPVTSMSYILFGVDSRLTLPAQHKFGIRLLQRDWADLAWDGRKRDLARSGLARDLHRTLGRLGARSFAFMNERTLRMNLDVTGIGKAGNLLSAICKDLGVRDSYREFQAEFNEPKHDGEEASPCFGVYINHPPPKKGPSEKHIALSRAVQSSSGRIVWCGYELDAHRPGRSCCSVWLYCRDQKRATWLRGRMTTVKGKRPPVFDSDRWHVVVNKPLESTQTDFDWFNSVLSAVIAVGKSA